MASITVYTTTNCAYCPMAKRYLDMKHIKYDTINLDDKPELRQEVIEKSGAMTVPVTVKGDWEAFAVGWQPAKIAELIK